MNDKDIVILKRFARGFVAGGIASIIPLLAGVVNIQDATAIKKTLITFAIAFITGGIQALDKLLRWVEPEQPIPVNDSEIDTETITQASTSRSTKKS